MLSEVFNISRFPQVNNHSIGIIVRSYDLFISLYSRKTDEKPFLWAIHYFLKVYLYFFLRIKYMELKQHVFVKLLCDIKEECPLDSLNIRALVVSTRSSQKLHSYFANVHVLTLSLSIVVLAPLQKASGIHQYQTLFKYLLCVQSTLCGLSVFNPL